MGRTIELSFLQQGCDRGMWGAFHSGFYALLSKQQSRASHAKGLEQRCTESSARPSIPWAFFPAWVSPCPTVSHPCPINSLSFSSSLSLLCQPAVVISFPFLLENPKSWQNSGLLSPGFWMGRSCKELEKDYISLTLIFQFPC